MLNQTIPFLKNFTKSNFKSTVMRKVSKQSITVFRFCSKINTTYQGLLWATSILTLCQKLSPQAPCVVLGLKSVIWSLWTLCPSTAKVWCAEICSCVFQYGLGQCLITTEKTFEIRQFFLVAVLELCPWLRYVGIFINPTCLGLTFAC